LVKEMARDCKMSVTAFKFFIIRTVLCEEIKDIDVARKDGFPDSKNRATGNQFGDG
jgi:hypothetical protein